MIQNIETPKLFAGFKTKHDNLMKSGRFIQPGRVRFRNV